MLYNNDYDEYMRSVLNYTGVPNNTYVPNNYNTMKLNQYPANSDLYDIEQMYPEIYKVINPMVCKMCDENNQPITEDLLEQMTDKIYNTVITRIEADNIININIDTREVTENKESNRVNSINTVKNKDKQPAENRAPVRRRNQLLRDLIRILLINQLLKRNTPSYRSIMNQRHQFYNNNLF